MRHGQVVTMLVVIAFTAIAASSALAQTPADALEGGCTFTGPVTINDYGDKIPTVDKNGGAPINFAPTQPPNKPPGNMFVEVLKYTGLILVVVAILWLALPSSARGADQAFRRNQERDEREARLRREQDERDARARQIADERQRLDNETAAMERRLNLVNGLGLADGDTLNYDLDGVQLRVHGQRGTPAPAPTT